MTMEMTGEISKLSLKKRWAIVLVGAALHPVFLYLLYPIFHTAINATTFIVPVVATLLLGLRVGILFSVIGMAFVSLLFSRFEPGPNSQGLARLFLASTLIISICFGAHRLRLYLILRRKAEAELAHREKQYRLIFEHSSQAILCLDEKGIIVDANPQVEPHLGHSPEELIGSPFNAIGIVSSETVSSITELIEDASASSHELSVHAKNKQQELVILDLTLSSVQQDDNPTRWICMLKDITERRDIEAQLQQSRRMEAIGRLAGGMAHDINNILNAIMGSAFALSHEVSKYGRFEDLENITTACDRGAQLTRNLLGFARKNRLDKERFSLNSVVNTVLALLERTVPKDIEIVKTLEDIPMMLGDQGQIENAVMNLGLNAIDAMGDAGRLTLSTHARGDDVGLTIQDTGAGIDASIRDKIFEPFFTTKAPGKGTGLGLAMVYDVVQIHHGNINIDSGPGRGTVVTLTFPKAASQTACSRISSMPKIDDLKNTVLASRTVLLIDDEPLVRRAGIRMLGTLGCEVLSTDRGQTGIELFKEHRQAISLIILDLVMPEMDGIAVLREIRKTDREVPVLLSSGYAPEPEQLEHIRHQITNYSFLTKPYRAYDLAEAAERLMSPSNSDDATLQC